MPPPSVHRLFASIVIGGAAIGCAASHPMVREGGVDAPVDAGADAAVDAGTRDGGVMCSCGTCEPGRPDCDEHGCAPCIF